jgi:hypothetical protein
MSNRSRKDDEALLTEIKANFDYDMEYWREIRKERNEDMKVISGDVWPKNERSNREAGPNPRLCLDLDEVNQYVNSCVNDMREANRAIKVTPKGNGAEDEAAQIRAGIIRGIEYESKADRVYTNAYQAAVEGSYGFWKLKNCYERNEKEDSLDQVLCICPVINPDTILLDPSAKELDCSDMKRAFEVDSFTEKEFKEAFPNAEVQSFTSEIMKKAPAWITGTESARQIQVAAYWKVTEEKRKLVLMEDGTKVFMDEIPGATFEADADDDRGGFVTFRDGRKLRAVDWADKKKNTVCQYITNGVEILKETPWDGKTIPIYAVFGKRIYVDKGAGSKLIILSLVRLARPAVLLYCYARTAQAQLCGQAPKFPLIGYEGQFNTNTPWSVVNRVELGYAEVKATTPATGSAILPKPEFVNFEPPIQALEVLAVAAQRAIQAAMGITGLLNGQRGAGLIASQNLCPRR